jgi:hypothetical protein
MKTGRRGPSRSKNCGVEAPGLPNNLSWGVRARVKQQGGSIFSLYFCFHKLSQVFRWGGECFDVGGAEFPLGIWGQRFLDDPVVLHWAHKLFFSCNHISFLIQDSETLRCRDSDGHLQEVGHDGGWDRQGSKIRYIDTQIFAFPYILLRWIDLSLSVFLAKLL